MLQLVVSNKLQFATLFNYNSYAIFLIFQSQIYLGSTLEISNNQ
jgi:hypothetical protein